MYGIVGILLALRYRNTTGEGQKLTTGIFESLTHWMSYWITYAQLVGEDHPPLGASHPSQAVYDAFELADGEWVFVGVVSEGQWRDLCEILDRPDIFTDPRYETDESRLEHKTELLKAIAGELSQRNREKVLIELTDAGIPAAPVNAPSDLVNDPHLEELGMLVESQTSDGESTFRSLLTPISNEHVNPVNIHDPPQVGEHTEELLEQFGYDRAEREALRENSAVDY
jgi:crotonobetainyl-CoA:carnitine CoA-transferase CaiB-like acyl-CoA transferase